MKVLSSQVRTIFFYFLCVCMFAGKADASDKEELAQLLLECPSYRFSIEDDVHKNGSALPQRLRKLQFQGKKEIAITVSGQFDQDQIREFIDSERKVRGFVPLIVNLRKEPIFFVETTDGRRIVITLMDPGGKNQCNKDKSILEIQEWEKRVSHLIRRIRTLKVYSKRKWGQFFPESPSQQEVDPLLEKEAPSSQIETLSIAKIQTECQFLEEQGLPCARFPVSDYHAFGENPNLVDQFINLIESARFGDYYIHCHGGSGRSTQAVAMIQIMNSEKLEATDFKKIIAYQREQGGADLLKSHDSEGDPDRLHWAAERAQFMSDFFTFWRSKAGNMGELFSDWIETQTKERLKI